ncbi:uncharacterized protein LOC111713825 isoform X2 [Eurytemora carolleeae]|uniref:uncharacterized protein LOC111713825 isoform X2 n=1 Tax=Eurytemora carolleeae TaxID=1294199 RepID=UPI000C77DF54|nr:uncharacterized protein LOC111713825 isoform X2 [Eurytemora carolleeae]|eukprot:XP_023344544.1 uncharacterized protein LOC111713825 isoform X2 [Eurytemora affinis]
MTFFLKCVRRNIGQTGSVVCLSSTLWFTRNDKTSDEPSHNTAFNYKEDELPPLPANPPNIPSPSLTHAFLLKQASLLSIDSSSALLNRTMEALFDLNRSYCKHMEELAAIYDLTADKLPLAFTRYKLQSERDELQALILMFEYSKKLMESSIETSFLAGAEQASTHASQYLHTAQSTVEKELRRTKSIEISLRLAEKYHIENAEGDAKEPQENPRVLDKESFVASAQELKPTPAITESSTEIQISQYEEKEEDTDDKEKRGKFSFLFNSDEQVKISIKEENEDDIVISSKTEDEEPVTEEEEKEHKEDDIENAPYKMPTY